MSQNKRMLTVVLVLALSMAALVVYNALVDGGKKTVPADSAGPGMIALYVDGVFKARIMPSDLTRLPRTSLTESEGGKTLEGWLLKDIIALYSYAGQIPGSSEVTVLGVGKKRGEKTATLNWEEVSKPEGQVLLHPSQDGQSLKLVGSLECLDTRDEWVQGVTRIDIRVR